MKDFGIYTDCYNSIIADLDSGKFLPNPKDIRKQILDAKKAIKALTEGSAFCRDLQMLEKTERRIQQEKDKLRAMNEVNEYIKKKYNL